MNLDFGSYSYRVWDINEIICAHALVVLQKLNVDSYSYVSMYYHSITLSSTYKGCIYVLSFKSFLLENPFVLVAFYVFGVSKSTVGIGSKSSCFSSTCVCVCA